MRHADLAMYDAKAGGGDRFRFFSPQMGRRAQERLHLETGLRVALEHGELRLHYQPRLELGSGRLAGAEALVRWQHPERGLVSPGLFVPLAEESGLVLPMGEWVLREACTQVQRWTGKLPRGFRMAANLSPRQFQDPHLLDRVLATLEETGTFGHQLELELTESALTVDPSKAAAILTRLAGRGIAISVDDFGTGYSSLAHLKRFPLDALKIDRSFVRDLPHDAEDAAIVHAIVSLARSLGLTVVAEGVEQEEQASFLRDLGCEQVQGFFFGRPVPAAEFEQAWLGG